jgi:glycosyltransferase involved in cell wall biosynthesis
MAGALLKTIRQYDVVHIHWLYNFSSLAAAWTARWAGVPYVFQPNGSLDPHLMRRNSLVKGAYNALFGSYILRNASGIIYTTQAEQRLAGHRPGWGPAHVIPVGLDQREYANLPLRGVFRQEFPTLKDKQVVLFLSRISRQKGLDLLIPAFRSVAASYPKAHLVLAGSDGEGYGQEVKRWVTEAGLTDRVTFAGRIPDQLKLAAYVDCDVFVLPSYAENFGAVVTEALACRRPVVISNQVNLCDEIAAAEAGIVVKCTVESVTAGIMRVLDDPALAGRLGENGWALVQKDFTWEVALRKLRQLYQELKK